MINALLLLIASFLAFPCLAMDAKSHAEPQKYALGSSGLQKSPLKAHTAPDKIISKPKQPILKAGRPALASKRIIPLKCTISNNRGAKPCTPALAPITVPPLLKLSDERKFELFIRLCTDKKELKTIYTLANDPIIKKHIKEHNLFDMLLSLIDLTPPPSKQVSIAKGANPATTPATILEHAIDDNNAPFIGFIQKHIPKEQRANAIRYAAFHKKPQCVLALIPKDDEHDDAMAVKKHFYTIPDLKIEEIEGYEATIKLCEQYKEARTKLTEKMLVIKRNIGLDLSRSITRTDGIITSSIKPKLNTQDPLERAAHYLDVELLKKLIRNSPYISPEKIKRLKDIARHTLSQEGPSYKIKQLMKFLDVELPSLQKYEADYLMITDHAYKHTGGVLGWLNRMANPNCTYFGGVPLVSNNNTNDSILKLLLMHGANPNTTHISNQTVVPLLFNPMIKKNLVQTKMLLEYGADANARCVFPNKQSRPPFEYLMDENLFDQAEILARSIDVDTVCQAGLPLVANALLYDPKYLETLLNNGFDPNATFKNEYGNTISVLEQALWTNKPKHMQLLLDYGAQRNSLDAHGYPLVFKALLYDSKLLEILLKNGFDPNTTFKDKYDVTASILQEALFSNKPEHMQLLLDYGAQRNSFADTGQPLIYEALFCDPKLLEILLKNGFSPHTTVKDKNGNICSIFMQAVLKKKPEHMHLVLNYGARKNTLPS